MKVISVLTGNGAKIMNPVDGNLYDNLLANEALEITLRRDLGCVCFKGVNRRSGELVERLMPITNFRHIDLAPAAPEAKK